MRVGRAGPGSSGLRPRRGADWRGAIVLPHACRVRERLESLGFLPLAALSATSSLLMALGAPPGGITWLIWLGFIPLTLVVLGTSINLEIVVIVFIYGAAFIAFTLWAFGHTYFLLPLVVAGMYAGCCMGKIANRIITSRWIVITGGMCYTIYLYHVPIIARMFWEMKSLSVATLSATTDFLWMCLLIVPAVFVLCALLFVLAEKPFMRWSLTKRENLPAASVVNAECETASAA